MVKGIKGISVLYNFFFVLIIYFVCCILGFFYDLLFSLCNDLYFF